MGTPILLYILYSKNALSWKIAYFMSFLQWFEGVYSLITSFGYYCLWFEDFQRPLALSEDQLEEDHWRIWEDYCRTLGRLQIYKRKTNLRQSFGYWWSYGCCQRPLEPIDHPLEDNWRKSWDIYRALWEDYNYNNTP